jgi:DNA-binding CsgD family transcriptional regulator
VIRASFWHVYSGALRLAARYEEALEASKRTAAEIDRFDLGFARAYVQLTRSLTYMGLASYEEAGAALDEAAAIGAKTGDVFIQLSERVNRCRLLVLLGQADDAVECTTDSWPKNVTAGLLGELHACRALAVFRSGQEADIEGELALAGDATRENEASMLVECTRALIALDESPSMASSLIAASFQTGVSRSVLDPFVFAFKLDRRLPRLLHRNGTLRLPLRDLRPLLADTAETSGPRHDGRYEGQSLTPRESEVLDLMAAGLTNAEIASTLFLAAPTVKVHVRSVLRKLGVRTRTEAAVYAVTRRRPGAVELRRPPEEPPEGPDSRG